MITKLRPEATRITRDRDEIRRWTEERGGCPAVVASTMDGSSGVLRIDFGDSDQNLEEISWDEFFRIFDENDLALLYQEETKSGQTSRFNKFVERSEVEEERGTAADEEETEDEEEDEEEKREEE